MGSNYDDIIAKLTVSSSSPWSETNETVGKFYARYLRVHFD